jgi:hypothetical protein
MLYEWKVELWAKTQWYRPLCGSFSLVTSQRCLRNSPQNLILLTPSSLSMSTGDSSSSSSFPYLTLTFSSPPSLPFPISFTLPLLRGGKRLYAPAQPFIKGIYSSDPHILTRIDISAEDTREANEISLDHPQGKPIEFTLLLSQNDKKRDVSYTLSVYSTSLPFACRLLPPLPLNQVTIPSLLWLPLLRLIDSLFLSSPPFSHSPPSLPLLPFLFLCS